MKTCPICKKEHSKCGIYCSRSCAVTATWQDKEMRKRKIDAMNTDEYKENVRKERLSRNDNPEYKQKLSAAAHRNWNNIEYAKKVKEGIAKYYENETEEMRNERITKVHNAWDTELRTKHSKILKAAQTPEELKRKSLFMLNAWQTNKWKVEILQKRCASQRTTEYSEKRSEIAKQLWKSKRYRDMIEPYAINALLTNRNTWNNKSYPAKIAKEVFELNDLKFKEEYRIDKSDNIPGICYFIDFYFEDKKVAIEIDGPQHYDVDGNLSDGDIIRDKYMFENFGITTHRIKWQGNTIANINKFKENLINVINNIYEK